ncbi:MAG: phosphoribosyl transferase [Candidatus Doudnabacteria bacterium RIFCSPHIGHO2_01_FULL_46_14]|uniref:Phosphoribosyl transferase n=1 Tax=Candidatus Doudnabacteria bacterium RIFCSPHIGHO2_01_FULL_46_14 TaxID=1817824 RepID=A0A1F5NJD9_9BACT|nr:MAG: phosphoribosyl transferase [Candidatus Doudnabacteria bacterium RIFCSPHIGHO2_01_FULL_46_14]
MHFKDRQHAAKQLFPALEKYKGRDVVVYALPRGGVMLGVEIARHLGAAFDLLIPRKIGHPYDPEYAIAAVSESGEVIKNEEEHKHIDQQWFAKEMEKELVEIKRRRQLYLDGRKSVDPKGKIAIIVDDGLATGLTMKVAIKQLRNQKIKSIIVAVPVAPADTAREIGDLADELIALHVPSGFAAISAYYRDFPQVSDEEVISLIKSLEP